MITIIIVGWVCLSVGFVLGCVYVNSKHPYDDGEWR